MATIVSPGGCYESVGGDAECRCAVMGELVIEPVGLELHYYKLYLY